MIRNLLISQEMRKKHFEALIAENKIAIKKAKKDIEYLKDYNKDLKKLMKMKI